MSKHFLEDCTLWSVAQCGSSRMQKRRHSSMRVVGIQCNEGAFLGTSVGDQSSLPLLMPVQDSAPPPGAQFHDFLGMSPAKACEKQPLEGAQIERRGVINSEVLQFNGRKTALTGPEVGCLSSRSKRRSNDMSVSDVMQGWMLPGQSPECSNITKAKQRHEGDVTNIILPPYRPLPFTMRPARNTTSEPPDIICGKPMRTSNQQEHRILFNRTPLHKGKETVLGTAYQAQPAADEGSRTGIKGSEIIKILNPNSISGVVHNPRPVRANLTSDLSAASVGRQMTIFYNGHAHVFDSVHQNKADVILALAGSTGVSWTTTYSLKPDATPPTTEHNTINLGEHIGGVV